MQLLILPSEMELHYSWVHPPPFSQAAPLLLLKRFFVCTLEHEKVRRKTEVLIYVICMKKLIYTISISFNSLQVYDVKTQQQILEIPKQKTSQLSFSSCGNFLSTWEGYFTTPDKPKGSNNLEIYRIGDGRVVKSFVQKRQDTW